VATSCSPWLPTSPLPALLPLLQWLYTDFTCIFGHFRRGPRGRHHATPITAVPFAESPCGITAAFCECLYCLDFEEARKFKQFQAVCRELINSTLANPTALETTITEAAAVGLKKQKFGQFQNEVDYRLLLPVFSPPESVGEATKRFRADLIGYTQSGFVLSEFKILDELKRNKNPWGVLYFLDLDRLKLEAAVKANSCGLSGAVCTVVAVRNTDFSAHPDQVNAMIDRYSDPQSKGRCPAIRNSRCYPILEIAMTTGTRYSDYNWSYRTFHRKNVDFLVGILPFSS
jgi:hypothetical protein